MCRLYVCVLVVQWLVFVDFRVNHTERSVQERIRVLRNQNRFLNEEVRQLASLRMQEQSMARDLRR